MVPHGPSPFSIACSRLRDGGEKSFSKKKCEKRAGAGERQGIFLAATSPFPKLRPSYFRFGRFTCMSLRRAGIARSASFSVDPKSAKTKQAKIIFYQAYVSLFLFTYYVASVRFLSQSKLLSWLNHRMNERSLVREPRQVCTFGTEWLTAVTRSSAVSAA